MGDSSSRTCILVVEDHPHMAEVLRRVFTREGFECLAVDRGGSAIALVSSRRIHAVVLDLLLPDMDGLDVCRRMRADGFVGPVLVLSGLSGPQEVAEACRAGATAFLAKPCEYEELIARIRDLLGERPAESATVLRFEDLELDLAGGSRVPAR